ncbi:Gluconate transport-inducing protein [Coemansia sp. RSA 1646]|nr:Gluconate transport-inducing protein [Coemansia sp. RSA 1646]KAJ2086111.1 Gluconate transport-inducing protein [Coemansia sp. RSA 986]
MADTRMETYYGFVSTSEDALALFEACRLGYKQRVTRRLSDSERGAIRSGSVFVWEEGESGMKRWTDGRSWSPSRVQGCFLTYHEWEGRRRAQRHPSYHTFHGFSMPMNIQGMPAPVQSIPMGIARYGHFIGGPTKAGSTQVQYGFPKENGMLKKALSIRTTEGKKLHLIAYYSKEDHAKRRLLTPTTDVNFPKLVVPPNLYPDMSPESMYGASHATANRDTMDSNNNDSMVVPDSAVDNNVFAHAKKSASLASSNTSNSSCSSSNADNFNNIHGGGKMHKVASQHATTEPGAEGAMDESQNDALMHSSPDDNDDNDEEYANNRSLAPRNPIPVTSAAQPNYTRRHLRQPSPLRLSGPQYGHRSQYPAVTGAIASADCVDVISDRLHRARVQSLVIDAADVPSPLHSAAISRPAPEHMGEPGNGALRYPHSAHPMNTAVGGTRPSSNSFSGEVFRSYGNTAAGGSIQAQLGLPRYEPPRNNNNNNNISSSSAPSSTVMRPSRSSNSATVPSSLSTGNMYSQQQQQQKQHHPPMISEATLMQAHAEFIDSCAFGPQRKDSSSNYKAANDGSMSAGGRGNRYLGLNGPLGLSGSAGVRRSTPLRLATSATVMVRSPCAEPLSEKDLDGPQTANPMSRERRSESSTLPLLLSPLALSSANLYHHHSLATAPASAMGFEASLSRASTIQLAGIHRDVKEGPRRLPSISASIRDELSPQEHSAPLCSPGGLEIYGGSLGLRVPSSSALLPSPLPTPLQSMSRGFDGDRVSPRKTHAESLSILASAADRAQVRHASISHRNSTGHHPYTRSTWKRGPTMRSVSLKQSEDIRQLGILDQGLQLK